MDALRELWTAEGLEAVEAREIAAQRTFVDFEEFWSTSTGTTGTMRQLLGTMTQADAERALEDFNHRAKGGVPDDIPAVTLAGAPLAIGQLLKQANLVPSTSEALRNIEQGGVKIDGTTVSDKGLKVEAGEYVVQVGKRRFARVTLTA